MNDLRTLTKLELDVSERNTDAQEQRRVLTWRVINPIRIDYLALSVVTQRGPNGRTRCILFHDRTVTSRNKRRVYRGQDERFHLL